MEAYYEYSNEIMQIKSMGKVNTNYLR